MLSGKTKPLELGPVRSHRNISNAFTNIVVSIMIMFYTAMARSVALLTFNLFLLKRDMILLVACSLFLVLPIAHIDI